jgi:hypothetical protein
VLLSPATANCCILVSRPMQKTFLLSLFDLAKSDREEVMTQLSSIQTKTGFLLTGSSILSSLVQVYVSKDGLQHFNVFIRIGLVGAVVTILMSSIVLWGDVFLRGPTLTEIDRFLEDFQSLPEDAAMKRLLQEINHANEESNKVIREKAFWLNVSIGMFVVTIISLFLGVVMH